MARFHIRKDGTPGECHAQPGNCPLGGEGQHYPTLAEAQAVADYNNAEAYSDNKQVKHKTLSDDEWSDFMEEADLELDVPIERALFILPNGHLMGDKNYTGTRFTDHNVVYTDPTFTEDNPNKSDLEINREFQLIRVIPESDPITFLVSKNQEFTNEQQEYLDENGFETTIYG